jgi:glycosyltransferase involved in cell wall biosynthesis
MKILVAHNRYHFRGGEDTVVDAEVELLRDHGHEVFVYLRDNRELSQIKPHAAAIQTVWSQQSFNDVIELCKNFQPDVIHSHNTFPLISPSVYSVAKRWNIPLIQTLHNFRLICPQATLLRQDNPCEDCIGKLPWRAIIHRCYRGSLPQTSISVGMITLHRLLRTWTKQVTRYIVLNQMCRDKFIEGGIPFELLRIKPNFLDAPIEPQWNHRHGGVFIGRLSNEKGLHVLAEAVAHLPNVCIDVFGNGPLETLVKSSRGFRYWGFQERDKLHEHLRQAAYLVVPSTGVESFGLVAIEAFACGTPVIACAHGGLREIIVHGKTGIFVEPGNPVELANAIDFAENHPDEMKVMGRAARKTYLARYTSDTNYQILMKIYQEALDSLEHSATPTLPLVRSKKSALQNIQI